jgi:hypothetical protein
MEVKLAVLADFASVTREGKLNVLGIFQEISPPSLPTVLPICYVVVAYEAGPAEVGSDKNITLALQDADGAVSMQLEQNITVPVAPRQGNRSLIHQINALIQLPLEQSGDYQFVIMINGEEKSHIPFRVNEPTEAPHATSG